MHTAALMVVLVVAVGGAAGLSRRLPVPTPLLLTVLGIAASFVPWIPSIELNPEIVLVGLLPPLLYAAAIRTSLVDLRADRSAIVLLSVVLVVVTTVTVGLTAWLVVPGVGIAAALALGAVVAPPDAVAATAIGRRVGMPRRTVSILEGESLLNDATALVALNTAVAALTTSVTWHGVALDLLVAAVGGVIVGWLVAQVLSLVRARIDDPVLDTTLSFVAPYAAFLPAEQFGASGVLAVVVTGLLLGQRSPVLQSGASRIAEQMNWRTVQFLLENVVFLLIGLQVRAVLTAVADEPLLQVVGVCAAVVAATVVTRALWVLACTGAFRVGTPRMRANTWTWSGAAVISWAGMRGVVTLAAAFALPPETPFRNMLVLAALAVVAVTLLVQGGTLPALVRLLRLPAPSRAQDALAEASLISDATRAGLARLTEVLAADDPEEVIEQLRERADRRTNLAWERLGRSQTEIEPPAAAYRRLRLLMLTAEREAVVAARDAGTADDVVLRRAMAVIDVEESLLERVDDAAASDADELVAPSARAGDCEHLREAPTVVRPNTPGACEDCLAEGTQWVHLRVCLACGRVGCCDSSVGRHAERHHHTSGHPVMRSLEPGEAWRWCYVDGNLG